MRKRSEVITALLPHQQRAVARGIDQNLLLAHSVGSGKTLTSLAIADAIGKPAVVFTPASLVENYKKEIKKHLRKGPRIDVLSLPTAAARNVKVPAGSTVIVDEAHALRNPGTQRAKYLKEQLQNAGRVITLTGTPTYNNIANIAPLINLTAGRTELPAQESDFNSRYTARVNVRPTWFQKLQGVRRSQKQVLQREQELGEILRKWIDVYDSTASKPARINEYLDVEMDPEQQAVYDAVSKAMPRHIKALVRNNLPASKSDMKSMNSFLSGVRQVSNTLEGFDTSLRTGSKIRRAADILLEAYRKDPKLRALVYSNYRDSGVGAMAKELDTRGVPYEIFDGSLSRERKKEIVDRYNEGKLPVILGTGSASEGLDLQNTRLIQILEPHFNNSRLEQVVGRGIRYKSHDSLPPEERNVRVQYFRSLLRSGLLGRPTGVDEYLYARAAEKDELSRRVKELMAGKYV